MEGANHFNVRVACRASVLRSMIVQEDRVMLSTEH